MIHELSSAYDAYYHAWRAARQAQNKWAIQNLEQQHESFLHERNIWRGRWKSELNRLYLLRQYGVNIDVMRVETDIFTYTTKLEQEQQEFLNLSAQHWQLSYQSRRLLGYLFNVEEAATVNPHQAQLEDNEQGDIAIDATEAATVNPHEAQLKDNELGDTIINAPEAATVNLHDAQLRDNEQGNTESDTRQRYVADFDLNMLPEETENKMDASQVLPDNDPDDKA